MSRKENEQTPGGTSKDDRLKAALKANLAKRKAQARARASGPKKSDTGKEN